MKCLQYLARLTLTACLVTQAMADPSQVPIPDINADPSDTDYPVVITPTRLRQSLADVPASVTVITGDTLRRYGITRIEDALRMVPGMAVSPTSGNNTNINYHGTDTRSPRRMNVLIDGVSAYPASFSRVIWPTLSVAMEDIDRIEVIRGPDSSAYGPNSMMAVINILTRHPKDVEPALVSLTAGAHQWTDGTVRLARTIGATSVRITASTHHDTGLDTSSLTSASNHDSTSVKRLNVRAQHELSDGSNLDMQASHTDSVLGIGVLDSSHASYADLGIESNQASLRWTKAISSHHELQLDVSHGRSQARQSWRSCWPNFTYAPELVELYSSNPGYVYKLYAGVQSGQFVLPTGGTAHDDALVAAFVARYLSSTPALLHALAPNCGTANHDGQESRTQVEFQDTYVASDQWRFVSGLGFRSQSATSATYFDGTESNQVQWIFGHAEYRATSWLTANLGGYGESNSISRATFSPRLALNAHITDNQSLRAVVSKGTRTPDLFENRANWQYKLSGLDEAVNGSTSAPLFPVGKAHTDLASEEIWSRELGYMLMVPQVGLTLDARLFDDRLRQLISKTLSVLDFNPDNSGRVRLSGAEVQASWNISSTWSGWLAYSYLINRHASDVQETLQYERHSGAGGVSLALTDNWRASLAHYAASGNGLQELGYGRTDLTLAHAFNLGNQAASVSLTLGYLSTPTVRNYIDEQTYSTAGYDDRFSLMGQLRIAF
jgi:iron complex outermembrane receptor protein